MVVVDLAGARTSTKLNKSEAVPNQQPNLLGEHANATSGKILKLWQ
jgi:hypothetical protein